MCEFACDPTSDLHAATKRYNNVGIPADDDFFIVREEQVKKKKKKKKYSEKISRINQSADERTAAVVSELCLISLVNAADFSVGR